MAAVPYMRWFIPCLRFVVLTHSYVEVHHTFLKFMVLVAILADSKPVVRISNQLVRASQKMKLNEKRLLMLAISKVTESTIDEIIPVTVSEYSEAYSVDSKSCYRTMVTAQERLWGRDFTIDDTRYRWVITCRYETGEGAVSIRVHPDLKQHISELKSHYTQYLLRMAGDFKSIYSWRLFELLMQFRSTGLLRIELAEFRELMGVPDAYHKDFGLLRRKAINVPLDEIKKTGLPVKLLVKKRRSAAYALEFTFPTEQQLDIFKAPSKPVVNDAYITKHARPGESWDAARKRLTEELKKETPA